MRTDRTITGAWNVDPASAWSAGTADASGTDTADASGTGTTDASGTGTADASGAGTADASGTGTADASGTGTADASGAGTADTWRTDKTGGCLVNRQVSPGFGGCHPAASRRADGRTPGEPRARAAVEHGSSTEAA